MEGLYEVMNPWAEADLVPLKGISPRLDNLKGKKIGLFNNQKVGSAPMLDVVEAKLKQRYPDIEVSHYARLTRLPIGYTETSARYENYRDWKEGEADTRLEGFRDWVKGVDAVIAAVGD